MSAHLFHVDITRRSDTSAPLAIAKETITRTWFDDLDRALRFRDIAIRRYGQIVSPVTCLPNEE